MTEGSQSGKFGEEQTILRFLIQNGRMPNEFIVNFMTALLFGGVEQVSYMVFFFKETMLISLIQYKTLINKKIKTLYTLVLYREKTEVIVVQIKVKTKIAKS